MVENDATKGMQPDELLKFIDAASKSKKINVFDYTKAVSIIKTNKIKNASFGLDGDWKDSNSVCLKNGQAIESADAYLNSTWAIPTLVDNDTGKEYPCYTVEDKDTYVTRLGWNDEEIERLNNTSHQVTLDNIPIKKMNYDEG